MTRGSPHWSQVCPAQLPGSLISQHQQLLPQNTQHQRGRTQGSARSWGWQENRSGPGTAGLQNLHGDPCGLSPHPRLKAKCPTPTPSHTLPSQPQLQAWLDFLVTQVDREAAGDSKVTPRALGPQPPCGSPGLGRSQSGKGGLKDCESPPLPPFLTPSNGDENI